MGYCNVAALLGGRRNFISAAMAMETRVIRKEALKIQRWSLNGIWGQTCSMRAHFHSPSLVGNSQIHLSLTKAHPAIHPPLHQTLTPRGQTALCPHSPLSNRLDCTPYPHLSFFTQSHDRVPFVLCHATLQEKWHKLSDIMQNACSGHYFERKS